MAVATNFSLRPATVEDVENLAQLHVDTWRETYSELVPAEFFNDGLLAARRTMWRRIVEDPNPLLNASVAEVAGSLVGLALSGPPLKVAGEVDPSPVQLYNLYVLRAHHGSGIGQALLDLALPARPAVLWVARENPRAIRFYRRNGFEFDGTSVQDPQAPTITEVRMRRSV